VEAVRALGEEGVSMIIIGAQRGISKDSWRRKMKVCLLYEPVMGKQGLTSNLALRRMAAELAMLKGE
jgi:hypothetical protein